MRVDTDSALAHRECLVDASLARLGALCRRDPVDQLLLVRVAPGLPAREGWGFLSHRGHQVARRLDDAWSEIGLDGQTHGSVRRHAGLLADLAAHRKVVAPAVDRDRRSVLD